MAYQLSRGQPAYWEYGGCCAEEQVGVVMGLGGGGETDTLHDQFNVELCLRNQVCNNATMEGIDGGGEGGGGRHGGRRIRGGRV